MLYNINKMYQGENEMLENCDTEKLLLEIEQLKFLLKKAVEDLHICAKDPKGFMKVCEPIKMTVSYEADISNTLEPSELKFILKNNLSTNVVTHSYSFGTWKWRYEDKVFNLLKEGN